MIDFKSVTAKDKTIYDGYAKLTPPQGCEVGFANIFLWGDQKICEQDGNLLLFATFGKSIYPFPMGGGDLKKSIDAIIKDASEKDIPCVISSVYPDEKETLTRLYPNRFEFMTDRNWSDYVYNIDDLANLSGKKYHKKRNHLRNFQKNHSDYRVEVISESNFDKVKNLVEDWYAKKTEHDPNTDFSSEKQVFKRAMDNYNELELEGIIIVWQDEVLAVTFGSRLDGKTFDVLFEKADPTVDGAYTVVNYEFANYLKNKYAELEFINREEDMGLEGLRKAKLSYYPCRILEKYMAVYKGDKND